MYCETDSVAVRLCTLDSGELLMIRVVDVWHHYGIRPILKDVSLEVGAGELVAVLWPLKGYVEIDGFIS
jgi:hypothetical protein